MKRWSLLLLTSLMLAAFASLATAARAPAPWKPSTAKSAPAPAVAMPIDDDPDLPRALAGDIDKGEYLRARAEFMIQRFDGASFDLIAAGRQAGVTQMQRQKAQQAPFLSASAWSAMGPFPIPNGQTTTISTPVTGRVTAIVVHPANPDLVYIGMAQGGVWRSFDGGLNWVPLFDAEATLAIGSLALAPSNPSILYVGTGEANGSADSFFGLGLYRIDNADTAPVVSGPFNPTPTTDVIGARCFTGRSISRVLVDPVDPAIVFCSTTSGIGGLYNEAFGSAPPITGIRGIYRTTTGTSASPSFDKIKVANVASIAPDVSGNMPIQDMIYDPGDPTGNTIVCWGQGATAVGNGGIWRSTNMKAAVPSFVQTFATTVANARGTFASTNAGGVPRILLGAGESSTGTSCTTASQSGSLRISIDGGVTWSAKFLGGGGYCGGQCFYDLPVAISAVDANLILIGGGGNSTCTRVFARSTNGGATFTPAGVADIGMHADAHAITFAPSDPNVVYQGNDGGIWRSSDAGASFTSRNTAGLSGTQYQSLAMHPFDQNFTIGGTQDNGTQWYQPTATWFRADFGDGGNTVIDQNTASNVVVTMYHTYFNQTNAMGYARVTSSASASDGLWTFYGCGFGGSTANGMTCTASAIQFYAPMVRGPGNPNTLYFGSDVLYRSVNSGVTMTKVSQEPIVSARSISTIAIAPTNDDVRLVGLSSQQIWGTVTGAAVLTNMTNVGMPAHTIGRIKIDPTNANVAYVCYGGFQLAAGTHIWKTTNLLSGTPVWTPAGNGIPDVPVNAMAIDQVSSSRLWAGTDVGVYQSNDGGGSWFPYTTGMPVVTVFDMELHPVHRILRVATHGRGMYERLVDVPVATELALVGTEIVNGHPRLTWFSADGANELMRLYRRAVPGAWESAGDLYADGTGMITYEDTQALRGHSYEYKLGIFGPAGERMLGHVWVDVPETPVFALSRAVANSKSLSFIVTLPAAGAASLDLLDVSGRRLDTVDLSGLGAGEHTVSFKAAQRQPGMYWARLSQGDHMLSSKVALFR